MDDIDIENEIYNRLYEKNAHARQEILTMQDRIIECYRSLAYERPRNIKKNS